MLAFACIDACICLHRTEPTKGEARRLVRFSDQRIESTCETCDGTRGARTRAHPRPSSVLLRSFVAFSLKSFRGGETDVSAPTRWALDRTIEADAIVIFTDNETWANSRPILVWMNDYRRTINPAARLIVAGMTATDYSVVSPNDALGLNVAGFDTNAPGIISNFIRGFDSDDVESFSGEE